MRVLTLTQPWATLVAIGAKRIETRSWSTAYRGDIAIHAAKGFPKKARELVYLEPFAERLKAAGIVLATDLPLGQIIAVVHLAGVVATKGLVLTVEERAFGDYSDGRFAWVFGGGPRRLSPAIPCSGSLGLWHPPPHVSGSLVEQGFAA